MDVIVNIFNYINELGPSISMPILFIIIGLLVGLSFGEALKSGILYGIGFEGINLIIGYFIGALTDASDAISANFNLNLSVVDAGWPLGASMAFSSSLLPLAIISIIGVNILLVTSGFLKTLNIDIWNYWQIIALGAMVYTATGSFGFGLGVIIITSVVVAKLADIFAPHLWEMGNVAEGISMPHLDTISLAPIYYVVNKIIDKIPYVKDWDLSLDIIQDKVGVLGDPAIMGSIVGALLGFLAGFDIPEILNLAIVSGATMVLFPRMTSLLMDGLTPIANAVRDIVAERFEDKDVYIGVDAAVGVGDPTVLIVGILAIPIILILSAIVPGNQMLPFATLSSAPFYVIWAVAITDKNIFRSLVSVVVGMVVVLLAGTFVANVYTEAVLVSAPELIPAGTNLVSSMSAGNPIYAIVVFILRLFGFSV